MLLVKQLVKRSLFPRQFPLLFRYACDTPSVKESGCTCPCCIQKCSSIETAQLRHPAPDFKAKAWQDGFKEINLSEYKGKYLVLFFYPLDFTFVCPTEIIDFSKKSPLFKETSIFS